MTTVLEGNDVALSKQITNQLLRIGSLKLNTFAGPASDFEMFQPTKPDLGIVASEVKALDPNVTGAVAKLDKACQKAFGSANVGLEFEYLEEFGPLKKRCILEIRRPDGLKRVYSTKNEFSRKSEAKTKVASIAVDSGAIDFIFHGDEQKGKGYVLAPIRTPPRNTSPGPDSSNTGGNVLPQVKMQLKASKEAIEDIDAVSPKSAFDQIEDCCREWRAGRIKPIYYFTSDSKCSDVHGCALKFSITEHISRTYSVLPAFEIAASAQSAVAELAIEQGIIEFIQHGDGQQDPLPHSAEYGLPENLVAAAVAAATGEHTNRKKGRPANKPDQDLLASKVLTVSEFFDSLPQPLPEPVGVKSSTDTNPVAWLNSTIQRHRGSNLTPSYTWTSDPKFGLHGCALRIEQSGGANCSFLVDPVFARRQDAKVAVCLEAISHGVMDWIRSVDLPFDDKLTKEMKDHARDVLIPAIQNRMQRLRPSQRPEWNWTNESQACGCTLKISTPNGTSKTFTVPAKYRSRVDAKYAVVTLAVEEGALEFLSVDSGVSPPLKDAKAPLLRRPDRLIPTAGQRHSDSQKRKASLQEPVYSPQPQRMRHSAASRGRGNNRSYPDNAWLRADLHRGDPLDSQYRGGPGWPSPNSYDYYNGSAAVWTSDVNPFSYTGNGYYGRSSVPPRELHYPETYRDLDYPYPPEHDISQGYEFAYLDRHQYGDNRFPQYSMSSPDAGLELDYSHEDDNQSPSRNSALVQPAWTRPDAMVEHPNEPYSSRYMNPTNDVVPTTPSLDTSGKVAGKRSWTRPVDGTDGGDSSRKRAASFGDVSERNDTKKLKVDLEKGEQARHDSSLKTATGSAVKDLFEYCELHNLTRPSLHSELRPSASKHLNGDREHALWMIVGNERMELPTTFSSLAVGQDKLARQVLTRLQKRYGPAVQQAPVHSLP